VLERRFNFTLVGSGIDCEVWIVLAIWRFVSHSFRWVFEFVYSFWNSDRLFSDREKFTICDFERNFRQRTTKTSRESEQLNPGIGIRARTVTSVKKRAQK